MDKKRVLNVKRKSNLFSTGNDFTSKAVLHDLYYSGRAISRMTKYDSESLVPKRFLEYAKNAMDEIILTWDKKEINTRSILNDKNRPYIFEISRLNKEELGEVFSTTCINRFEEALSDFGYHFDTNFTEEDLKKIFLIYPYLLQEEPNVKLSLEDDEICDYNKRKHIR